MDTQRVFHLPSFVHTRLLGKMICLVYISLLNQRLDVECDQKERESERMSEKEKKRGYVETHCLTHHVVFSETVISDHFTDAYQILQSALWR